MRQVIPLAAAAALLLSGSAWAAADSQAPVPPEKVKELVQMSIAGGGASKSAPKTEPAPEAVAAAKKITQSACEELYARVRERGVKVPGSCN